MHGTCLQHAMFADVSHHQFWEWEHFDTGFGFSIEF